MLNTGLKVLCLGELTGKEMVRLCPSHPARQLELEEVLTPAQHPVPRATASSNCSYEHIDTTLSFPPKKTFCVYFRD